MAQKMEQPKDVSGTCNYTRVLLPCWLPRVGQSHHFSYNPVTSELHYLYVSLEPAVGLSFESASSFAPYLTLAL